VAIYPRKPILNISNDDWDLSNGINIKGTGHVMVAAIQHMREQPLKSKARDEL
jgi:3-oxoacyl-[acyl-carrier protein] reductase